MRLSWGLAALATLVSIEIGAFAEDCNQCSDVPTPKMLLKNMACKDFPKQLAGKCKLQHNWVSEKICQRSCYEAGNGYDGDECCPAETTGTAIDGVPSESTSDVPIFPATSTIPGRTPKIPVPSLPAGDHSATFTTEGWSGVPFTTDASGNVIFATASPTPKPTTPVPTASPTAAPLIGFFHKIPTEAPTEAPTSNPTKSPTFAWAIPPTVWFPANPVPKNPPRGYYNYDVNDLEYGPSAWNEVSARNSDEYKYWRKYEEYLNPNLSKNYCRSKDDRQSPIDLNAKVVNRECLEYHEIRDKQGEFMLTDPAVEAEVLKDRLRISWPQEGWWDEIKGPNADIPKGWGDHYPVIHVDYIMPAAHTINGKQYVAEYTIWLMTKKGRGTPAISMLVEIDKFEQDNWYFQQAINVWQQAHDENQDKCRRRKRGLHEGESTDTGGTRVNMFAPDPPEGFDYEAHGMDEDEERKRKLVENWRVWNPFHEMMMTSIWFWGYEGSTISPPCYPFVEWRVIETPMTISTRQHEQLKEILFMNVDSDCKSTSIHADGGVVARPTVSNKGHEVHKCDCFDFLSDSHRAEDPNERHCGDMKGEKPAWVTEHLGRHGNARGKRVNGP